MGNSYSKAFARKKIWWRERFRVAEARVFEARDRQFRRKKHKLLYCRRQTYEAGAKPFGWPIQKLRTKFPRVLDFVDNTLETVAFFQALKEKTLLDPADEIIIDPSLCETLSPDAGLVLIAELTRSHAFNPNCKKLATSKGRAEIHELLGKIGYYKYFPRMKWEDTHKSSKLFLVHKTGNSVDPLVVKELIQHFEPVAHWEKPKTSTLYNAMVECMTNVLLHAYPRSMKQARLEHQWWLLASRDSETKEISFCFFDQGVGIPNTIRTRLKDRIPYFSKTDSEIIIKGVMEGQYSRTRKKTRGKGLPALKTFIDQAENGQLTIVTHKSKCIFKKDAEPVSTDIEIGLGGTLIIWTLKI